jgi:TrmH family RNA methyltransferase
VTLPTEFQNLCVVLVGARNPLNIGAAARAMSNFGFLRLRVVRPYDLAWREARSAVGASAVLRDAEEFISVADAAADCTLVVGTTSVGKREVSLPLRSLEHGARILRKQAHTTQVAILFGSEKVGLSNEDLSHCDWLMRIPTREEHRSVNLGQSVAICAYELARGISQSSPALQKKLGPKKDKPAISAELERLVQLLLEAFRSSGYIKPGPAPLSEEKWRRMVRRLNLSAGDAELWLGAYRKILWKMRSGK